MSEPNSRQAILAAAEIAEVLKDLMFAMLLPPGNYRIAKIAGCKAGFLRAFARIEGTVEPFEGMPVAEPSSSGSMTTAQPSNPL